MGKASRRKRQQRSSSHGDRMHPAAAEVPAPNFDGTAVQAIRDALAMVTSVHASPQDLPGLAEELAADRGRQGLVAYALVSRFITESARELADARGMTVPAVLEGITAGLETGDAEHHTALNRALASVRDYAEALDDIAGGGGDDGSGNASGPGQCRAGPGVGRGRGDLLGRARPALRPGGGRLPRHVHWWPAASPAASGCLTSAAAPVTCRDAAGAARPGQALGVDLSAPMIELARRLAAGQDIGNVSFEQADAQIHPFPAGSFDVAIPRTGTMFFGDPAAAFTNIGRALRPGGRLVMLAWQGPGPNEWSASSAARWLPGGTFPPRRQMLRARSPSLTPAVPGPCWPPRDSRMSGSTRCTSRCGSVPIPTTRTASCSA